MKMRILCAVMLLSAILSACDDDCRVADGSVWNTTFHIVYMSPRNLDDSVAAAIARVDKSLNVFNDSSLVAAVNRGDSSVRADVMLRDVMEVSRRVAGLSGGMFDPTVAPLVELWGFGRRGHDLPAPSPAQIDSALALVGIGSCTVAPDGRITRPHRLTRFDFSAVAKGYGVDEVARTLRRNGVTDYLVEIGGEVAVGGRNASGRPWRVMIDEPVESDSAVIHRRLRVIEPATRAVATSGNYRNYRTVRGRRVAHTISPLTGMPVASATLSATVVAQSCALADALATACMAMPAAEALRMVAAVDSADVLIVEAVDGGMRVRTTSGFPAAR